MPSISVLLIIMTIANDGSRTRASIAMPDVPTCQEYLKHITLSPNQESWCEYNADY